MKPSLQTFWSVGAAAVLVLAAGAASAQPPAPTGPITLGPSTTPAPGWTNNTGQKPPPNEIGPPLQLPPGMPPIDSGAPSRTNSAGMSCKGGMDTSHEVASTDPAKARGQQSYVRYPTGTVVYGDGRIDRAPGDCASYPTPH